MSRACLAAILALTLVPAAADVCCDLEQPAVAQARQTSAEPSCPLHAHSASERHAPAPVKSPAPCAHDLSIDRAGFVRTAVTCAPRVSIANSTPVPALQAGLASHATLALLALLARLVPDTSRRLVLRI